MRDVFKRFCRKVISLPLRLLPSNQGAGWYAALGALVEPQEPTSGLPSDKKMNEILNKFENALQSAPGSIVVVSTPPKKGKKFWQKQVSEEELEALMSDDPLDVFEDEDVVFDDDDDDAVVEDADEKKKKFDPGAILDELGDI